MSQELTALRDWLREHADDGVNIESGFDIGMPLTPTTVRDLVGLLDRLEREREGVDGVRRDV